MAIQNRCCALRDLVSFVQFKKRENTRGEVLDINTPLWMFFMFLKLYKWYQIPQRITDGLFFFIQNFKIKT